MDSKVTLNAGRGMGGLSDNSLVWRSYKPFKTYLPLTPPSLEQFLCLFGFTEVSECSEVDKCRFLLPPA